MKFPKLPCLVLLLSLQYLTAVAQVITIPTLSSSQGSTSTITFCKFDTVTFTATGDSGLTPLEHEFWIERGGTIVFPLGNGPQPQSSFATNTLQDGDIVHARVWTYDNGGGNALTNTITINLDEFSRPISFSSDTINNTICGDEIVEFTVSNVISTTLFYFYVDGIFIQGPSHQTTGFISSETIDPLGQSIGRISYLDLTASFLVHSSTFFAGLTFFHLNQPNISLDKEGDEKQAFELSFQGGTEIDLNPYQRGFLPDNSFLFLYNSVRFLEQNALFNFTQEVLFSSFFLSLNQRLSFSNATNINSIGFGMGIALEYFDFGIQFNAPLRKINQVFAPSVFELYFSFDFSPFRRNNRGVYKRLQIDNY